MKKFLLPSIFSLAICIPLYFIVGKFSGCIQDHIGLADTVFGYVMNFLVIFTVILGWWKRGELMKYIQ